MAPTYLITGASRGIGLELTTQLLALPLDQADTVFALTRSAPSPELQALLDAHPGRAISVIASITDTPSLAQAAAAVANHLGSRGLDVLVQNAGVSTVTPGVTTDSVSDDQWTHIFDSNVIGANRVIRAFLPLLQKGTQKKVINMSSTLGSLGWASRFAGIPVQAYNVSKAALHMLNMQYALDYADQGFTFLCISPGHLRTDLGGPGADVDVDVGVAEVRRIIREATPALNGKAVNIHVPGMEDSKGGYDGKEYPW